ncbi:MAG: 6-phosphogluconate dehydrogenase (decarboxylating) [Anaerolineaceae bacterium]|nr:6-phosphogluconate dehydrogenase (decarboxylating) [Anaerolineaceae bacterium]
MQLGMVGLGKMGAFMSERLLKGGHELVVTDLNANAIKKAEIDGATGAKDLSALVSKLDAPRAVWVMVPSGSPTESTISKLSELLDPGDIIIDGGNSYYKNAMRHAQDLARKDIHFVDVGTSGGVWGIDEGYSMMIGGEKDIVEHLRPIFETLAPAPDQGWGYVGPSGAGHFVKMVHNGIEYGMMQAYAEGFAILKKKEAFDLDLVEVSRIWQVGSVIRSWLLDLIKDAFENDQDFDNVSAYVNDSGEGHWTVLEAIDLNVSAPVITESLLRRIRSREDGYTDKLLAVMRNQFGGHKIKKVGDE